MNKRKTAVIAGIIGACIFTGAASCDSKFTEPFKDAPRSGNDDMTPMNVIDNSDGFSNIGWKCILHDGVYEAFHGDRAYASIFIVPNDPNCVVH